MHRHIARLMLIPGAAAMALLATGCAPWATYPPVEHTARLVDPAFEPMPTLMADAVRYADETYNAMDEPVFNLPEGVKPRVYDLVIRKLGRGRPMMAGDTRAYHITAIRTRGPEAEVDVVAPRADGLYELVTLHFKEKFGKGYQIASTRQWRLHVDVPGPHYVAPAEPTEVANVHE